MGSYEGYILPYAREAQAVGADMFCVGRELDTTVVLVAYRSGSIALADEVAFVADGAVVARGRHEDLLATDPAYAELVEAYDTDRTAGSGGDARRGSLEVAQ